MISSIAIVGLAALTPKRPLLGAAARVVFLYIGLSASFDPPVYFPSSAFLPVPIRIDAVDPLLDAIPAYPDIELLLLRAEPGSLVISLLR